MFLSRLWQALPGSLRGYSYKLSHAQGSPFTCSICGYRGAFKSVRVTTGERPHAQCPKCLALERHRIQFLVLQELAKKQNFSKMSILHFAPEDFFKPYFKKSFAHYVTADLVRTDVDKQLDLTKLKVPQQSFDVVYASHVLEHIKEDYLALNEIKRILKPGGIAILPVPLLALKTIEYDKPNPYESNHVRAPGLDYFNKYRSVFSKVMSYSSSDFDDAYQLYEYEDRSHWPTKQMPQRVPMPGIKHPDAVPVCLV